MKTMDIDHETITYIGRALKKAFNRKKYDYIGNNTFLVKVFDAGNMPEGMHLRVEVKVGDPQEGGK